MRISTILCQIACLALATSAATLQASPAPEQFTFHSNIPFNAPPIIPHGMAFDGTRWYIAHAASGSFGVYDPSFTYLHSVQVTPFLDVRGLAYDAGSDSLFVGDAVIPRVRQVTKTGETIGEFYLGVPNYMNAIAYDDLTESLWLAYFSNGVVENRSKTGALLSSYSFPTFQWTGLTLDTVRRSLILMEAEDTIHEFKIHSGLTYQGPVVGSDQVDENGQGLSYNSATGLLYVSSQFSNHITVFSRLVPEPTTTAIGSLGFLALGALRRRK